MGCLRHHSREPILVDGDRFSVLQDAHANHRMRIVQPYCQKAIFAVKDDGQIAGPSRVALAGNRSLEQPGMPVPQRTFRRRRHAQGDAPLGWAWDMRHGTHEPANRK